MKHAFWGVLFFLITGFLVGCGSELSTPASVIEEDSPEYGAREWIDAITNQDGNRTLKYTCLAQREDLQEASMWISAFSVLGQLLTNQSVQIEGDISDLKFETESQSDGLTEVRVYGELRIAVLGSAEAYQVDEKWQMVRENDTWRWCGSKTDMLSLAPQTVRFSVRAGSDWQDTGVIVQSGDKLLIRYVSEKWSPWAGAYFDGLGMGTKHNWPDNVLQGAAHASLIGKIGDNVPFYVGNENVQMTAQFGQVFLRINDTTLYDNSGSIMVTVEVER